MTDRNIRTDLRLCRHVDCDKPAAEGWMICADHVEARHQPVMCPHGNEKACIECLVESLREEAVTTPHNVPENELLALTARLDEHPEGWDHPCMCAECRSYADG